MFLLNFCIVIDVTCDKHYSFEPYFISVSVIKLSNVKPTKIFKAVKKILDSSKKIGIDGISSDELCSIAYHDYSIDGTLSDTHEIQQEAVSNAAKNGGLILSNPFDYAIKYCTAITDIPTSGSNNDLCNGSYPFLQIALGNSIPYTVEAINLNRSPETLFLSALATGSALHYDYILSDTEPISGTELNFLYSADFKQLREMTEKQYADFTEVSKATENSGIKEYLKEGNMVTTVFQNGVILTVDYNDKKYSITK